MLVTPLNSGLRSIMEKDVASGKSADGQMLFSKKEDGSINSCFARSGELSKGRHAIPFKVYVVGNLAFYAMALGKDGSSGQHCYLCDLPQMQWLLPGHRMGELWNLQKLHRCMQVWMRRTNAFVVSLANLWFSVLMPIDVYYPLCISWWALVICFLKVY